MPGSGLRKGVVINIEAAQQSVAKAIEAAELMSGREVRECFVGMAGANIEGINSRGVVAVAGRGREISQEDVDRVIEAARAVVIPMDREVLHVIPQTFIVDDQRGIRNPLDMIGVRLEAEVHIITGSVTSAQNLVRCVNRAGFKASGLVLQSLAASRAVLSNDEKELGCLLVDLGGGTSDALLFSEGAPYFSASVGIGGTQVTNDLSIIHNVSMDVAERIKRESGTCHPGTVDLSDTVLLPGVGGRGPHEVSSLSIANVMHARMEEILRLVRERVEQMGYWRMIKGGVVLTGGGAMMNGVIELAHEVFNLPVRTGTPIAMGAMSPEFRNPSYATGVGLVMMGAERLGLENGEPKAGLKERKQGSKFLGRLKDWFREFN